MSNLFTVDENKIALITGGSRGLGLYMAEGLLVAGAAKVYLSARGAEACEKAAKSLNELMEQKGLKGRAYPLPGDMGTRAGVEKLFADFEKVESRLDILIANAGLAIGQALETHKDKWMQRTLDLNIKGVFGVIQVFIEKLRESGTQDEPSRILITGSVAGIRTGHSGGTYGYLASKAAVHHLGKVLAVELGRDHVTVNVLAPGLFPTDLADDLIKSLGSLAIESNPRNRLGTKEDVMAAAVYLCSRAGNYLNGVVLPIDGGAHLTGQL